VNVKPSKARRAKPTEAQRIAKLSPRRQAQIAVYKRGPVALVTRPLRRIDDATSWIDTDAKGNKERKQGPEYRRARIAAQRGQGHIVRAIAQQVLA
jgi:hypothetical protein